MKHLLVYIISATLVLSQTLVFSQEEAKNDEVSLINNNFEIAIDYLKLGSFFVDFETKYEAQIAFTISKHYHPVFEYGYGKLNPEDPYENGVYESEGNYWRAGFDYILEINPKNFLLFGGRYGTSKFDDQVVVEVGSSLFSPYTEFRTDLSADWFEIVASSETLILKNTFMGFRLRLRILNSFDSPGTIETYAIPGYGRTFDKTIPAFNLYLKYVIPF